MSGGIALPYLMKRGNEAIKLYIPVAPVGSNNYRGRYKDIQGFFNNYHIIIII